MRQPLRPARIGLRLSCRAPVAPHKPQLRISFLSSEKRQKADTQQFSRSNYVLSLCPLFFDTSIENGNAYKLKKLHLSHTPRSARTCLSAGNKNNDLFLFIQKSLQCFNSVVIGLAVNGIWRGIFSAMGKRISCRIFIRWLGPVNYFRNQS